MARGIPNDKMAWSRMVEPNVTSTDFWKLFMTAVKGLSSVWLGQKAAKSS
jgi:hypothetical protein